MGTLQTVGAVLAVLHWLFSLCVIAGDVLGLLSHLRLTKVLSLALTSSVTRSHTCARPGEPAWHKYQIRGWEGEWGEG